MKRKENILIIAGVLVFILIAQLVVSVMTEITRKEISYTLTYTLYGEEKTLSGTAFCEFDCIGFSTNDGFKPRYCIYLKGQEEAKSTSLGITVLNLRGKEESENLRQYIDVLDIEKITGLSFSAGSARWYMKKAKGHNAIYNLDLSVDTELHFQSTGGIGSGGHYITPDEAEEVFGIRLIKFEFNVV